MKLQFNLDFFAAVMHAERKEVGYALLKQTENETVEYRPVVTVASIKHYVYDIKSAQFIGTDATPEVERKLEPAVVKKNARGYLFCSENSGAEEICTTLEFYRTYKTVVVNEQLR